MSDAPYQPAEPPADGDRAGQVPPRYSASASVPAPNPPQGTPYGAPAGAFGQGAPQFGQGAPQFGQPPAGQPQNPPGSAAGSARVGASASVPPPSYGPPPAPGSSTYGSTPQGFSGQATTYGQPGQQYGSGQQQQQYGQPAATPGNVYGAPQGGTTYGAAPGGGATYGSSPGGAPGYGSQPAAFGQPGAGAPAQSFGQPQPYSTPAADPGRPQRQDKLTPTGGWPYVEGQQPEPRRSRRGLTIAVIAVALLVVIGIGGYVGLKLATQGSDAYSVGACVRQSGGSASVVDCGQSGAYRITSVVDTENGCPDPSQPSLVLSTGGSRRYACLSPAS